MNDILNIAIFMSILSLVTTAGSISELAMDIVLTVVLFAAAKFGFEILKKINMMYDYMLTHQEKHTAIQKDYEIQQENLAKLEDDVELLRKDFTDQISGMERRLEKKMDDLIREVRNERSRHV